MSNFEDFDDGVFAPQPGGRKPNPVPQAARPVRAAGGGQAAPQAALSPQEAAAGLAMPQQTAAPQQRAPQAAPQAAMAPQMASGYGYGFEPMFAQPAASTNPLAGYYRAPGITVALPSNGMYMPRGSIALDMQGEIAVYPLTAADEILLKNPDALMSGHAVEQMLRSCVPGIAHPRLISSPDLDVLLLAVRAASYGNTMDVDVTCPKCKEEGTFSIDIRSVLATAQTLPAEAPVRLSADVVAYMRPFNLENSTRVALATFAEARGMQAMLEADEETRTQKMNESYQRLMALSRYATTDCVLRVAVPAGIVEDRQHIAEFMANIPSQWTKKMESAVRELNEMSLDRTIEGTCASCDHTFQTELQFDPASFFGSGS